MKLFGKHISLPFTTPSISRRDQKHIWHPLTQHKLNPELLAIKSAKGALLKDESGKTYIDAIASWYTSMYGHCHPHIIKKVKTQMETLDQVVFSGFTHEPAVELSEKLMEILPKNQDKLFFNDNGSTATEIGIKMALQYHHNLKNDRKVMLALEDGFHGDTFGAMSVSGLSVYNGAFEDHFIEVKRLPKPNGLNNAEVVAQLKAILRENAVAGFIYEPLVQGAAAMQTYDLNGLNDILKICKANQVICIADEVMTGFGKTGKHFASDYLAEKPDVMCLSKALSAGMVGMGITSCTKKIYKAFYADEVSKGLFHGHTYTGNPLACAAAIAGLELLQSPEIQGAIKNIMSLNQLFADKMRKHTRIREVRQIGVILAMDVDIEMERYGNARDKMFQYFMSKGIFLRPLGKTIYILPPYVITEAQLAKIYAAIEDYLDDLKEKQA
ncbi:adenosylmethionine--8-amino-7-oxononanoate transaminase [Psychroflexus sp. YR1-1]|uniref:Adenosylmethionine-8-amino-7-oxononanoate aminotransferase n=1 Tax=Psychroflexus aurantiacus TaxID=2709310 RepID=A0A6B3QWX5_9FLAO|nr:adenosylmethionine--8-amino-7-oxononanoate transaminase [Psychroflexus aurantiacus]NEV92596.1 adenosylmethionine--8-amino-7-oxononanoate transaminase [Psychroflexus aurantiacus]